MALLAQVPTEDTSGGEGDQSPKFEGKAPEPAPEPVKAAEPVPEAPKDVPDADLKGFDTLVREKAALRRREEALKLREAQFDPISKALDSDDPLAYLQASGKFTYEQLARQLIEGKRPEPQKARQDDPVVQEVQQLRKMLLDERANAQRAQAYASVVETVRGDPARFKFVAGRKMEQQVLQNLEAYITDTGSLPAEDMATSIKMAAEAVELSLRKEAASWAALLTPEKSVGSVPHSPENAVVRPKEIGKPAMTLTNAQASVPARPATPKTTEEYRAAALALFDNAENS
jgi:hypothetical protein